MLDANHVFQGKPISRIKVVELQGTRSDRVKDAIMPWHGTVLIASLLEQEGYEVEALVEPISEFDVRDLTGADALLVHVTAGNIHQTHALVARLRELHRIPVIAGGALSKVVPAVVANVCDFVVRGEGEDTIVELLRKLNAREDVSQVPGVSFWMDGALRHTASRGFTRRLDVRTRMSIVRGYTPLSVLEQVRRRKYFMMTVEASRGCPFACKFCITPDMYGSYRPRTVDTVIADLRDRLRYSRRIWFIDNLFAVRRDFVMELLGRMIAEGLHRRGNYTCFLRVENSEDHELLALMRRAGFVNVFVGFESIDDSTQRTWNKVIQRQAMARCIETFHAHGLRVHGSFIAGADSHRASDIDATVDWAIDNAIDYMALYLLIPIQMAENACVDRRRVLAPSWDYMDGEHATYFPMHMRPSTLQETVRRNLRRFYHPARYPSLLRRVGRIANPAGYPASLLTTWRAIQQVDAQMEPYLGYLRTIEAPYYDGEELREDRLPPGGISAIPWLEGIDPAVRLIKPAAPTKLGRRSKFSAPSCNTPSTDTSSWRRD